jgi:hypothetical protein
MVQGAQAADLSKEFADWLNSGDAYEPPTRPLLSDADRANIERAVKGAKVAIGPVVSAATGGRTDSLAEVLADELDALRAAYKAAQEVAGE